ncbi:MAG: DOMON-like domain-containing protein [Allosphingosinicella sp.]|uniref:DOMON-like domain-containing protein n=1 Tax=Allosphingosinicella sp. TaxID=2823234 RepID=UPI0039463075
MASIQVHVRRAEEILHLTYALTGELRQIRLPPPAPRLRRDELWRTTCFEAFVARPDGSYAEFNLSPSGAWAAYRFESYREGMGPLDIPPPDIRTGSADDRLTVEVAVALPWGGPVRLGLSAVVEEAEGVISYWALAHPAAKPDFHHPDSFVHGLP